MIHLYVAIATHDEYIGGGIVLLGEFDGVLTRREFGVALGLMLPELAIISTSTIATASITPAYYDSPTTIHCRDEAVRRALMVGDSDLAGVRQLRDWASRHSQLWLTAEGDVSEFNRAVGLASIAAVKQQNYDSDNA